MSPPHIPTTQQRRGGPEWITLVLMEGHCKTPIRARPAKLAANGHFTHIRDLGGLQDFWAWAALVWRAEVCQCRASFISTCPKVSLRSRET